MLKTYPLQPGDAYLITDLSYPAVNKATYVSSDRIEGEYENVATHFSYDRKQHTKHRKEQLFYNLDTNNRSNTLDVIY